MKNIFNGKRFLMLLKKEAYDLRSQYLKLMLIVACTFLVIFFFFSFFENNSYTSYKQACFVVGSVLVWGGTMFAPFQIYKHYNNKIYGVSYFMLPASQTEKWLSMFFHCVIVTPIVLILTITLMDLCLYPFYPLAEKSLFSTFSYNPNFNNPPKTLSEVLTTFFVFQSLFFLGNMWFQRSKVQKTILAIIILLISYIILLLIMAKLSGLIDAARVSLPFNLSINISLDDMSDIPQTWKIISKTISFLVAPIGLWIVSFMKMREQQL